MEVTDKYTQHVNIMKDLKMSEGFHKVREPYKEDFEQINQKANTQDVKVSNAKEFLNSLSKDELSTLQNYAGLADEINVGNLSDEGAYNLLVHHYEKYDFNNDGIVENGAAKTSGLIPQSMPNDEKKALVETYNSMDSKDVLMASMLFFQPAQIVNGQMVQTSNKSFDYNSIKGEIERILHPDNKDQSNDRFKEVMKNFFEIFDRKYNNIQEQKEYYNIK